MQSSDGLRHFMRVVFCHHFSPMRIYVHRPSRTVVTLNPKVGSAGFRRMLRCGICEVEGHPHASMGRWRIVKRAAIYPFAPVGDYVHALSHPREYDFFCFVRNPYARLKSAWLNKLAYGHIDGYPRSLRTHLLRPLRRFAGRQGLPGAEEDSAVPLDTFVRYVEATRPGHRDHHWDNQYNVLFMSTIQYTGVYRLETEHRERTTEILTRIGLGYPQVLQMLESPINRGKYSHEVVYDEATAHRVYAVYEQDFQLFGYPEDSWQGL